MIPAREAWPDGMFRCGSDLFTMTYRFSDINYAVASYEDKKEMFLGYEQLLNALDPGIGTQITLYNRKTDKGAFAKQVMLQKKEDGLDAYRDEYNAMLEERCARHSP